MTIGNPETVPFQAIHERRHDSSCYELSYNLAILYAALVELKNSLRRNRGAFHARDFGKFDNFPAAIVQSG